MLLKDDNLGLGAQRGQVEGHNFGLATFQDLLGRLNGKGEEELQKDQSIRADLGRRLYAEQKWGPARFVRGGFLVGDKIEVGESNGQFERPPERPPTNIMSSREERGSDAAGLEQRDAYTGAVLGNTSKEKKEKNRTKKTGKIIDTGTADRDLGDSLHDRAITAPGGNQESSEITESKEERRKRKLEKRARKEAKLQQRTITPHSERPSDEQKTMSAAVGPFPTTCSVDTATATPQPPSSQPSILFAGNRLAVRQRYIRQKKMSSMDPQALKEIFMLKS